MSFIFICIAISILTLIFLSWHIVGEWSEGVVLIGVFGIAIITGAGFIPFYSYHGNAHVTKYEAYETPFGYISMIGETIYKNTELHGSDPENVKVVDLKTKCGLGLYTMSNYHIVDITKSPWKEGLEEANESL